MAHAALIAEHGDRLVASVIGKSRHDPGYKSVRDAALRGLRNPSAARTNPFDVSKTYVGLVEKFEVLNRSDLATALQLHLDELPTGSRWLPECLSLLALLSDRPTQRVEVNDPKPSTVPQNTEPVITWQDLRGDTLEHQDLWEDVERGYHSSGDEAPDDEPLSDHTISTQATSIDHEDLESLAKRHLLPPDTHGFDQVMTQREHTLSEQKPATWTELDAIRETLSMLQGLPTTLYETHGNTTIRPRPSPRIATASASALQDCLGQFAVIGSSLAYLRHWVQAKQQVSFLRTCQSRIGMQLRSLKLDVARIEESVLHSSKQLSVVSILDVKSAVDELVQPFSGVISALQKSQHKQALTPEFAFLDELYHAACTCQMAGDEAASSMAWSILLSGVNAYLRPSANWMLDGGIDARDRSFFVQEIELNSADATLWHDRYKLRRTDDGRIYAPVFLQGVAERIFVAGKSRALLKALRPGEAEFALLQYGTVSSLDTHIDTMAHVLEPLSHVLSEALSHWVDSLSIDCKELVRSRLLGRQGILSTQRALEQALCSSDSAHFQAFADSIFWRLEKARGGWKDLLILSELAQSTLGAATDVDVTSLRVALLEQSNVTATDTLHPSSIRELRTFELRYSFPWPLQNITRCSISATHSRIFTLLLQLYRAKYLLRTSLLDMPRHGWTDPPSPESKSALKLRHNLLWLTDMLHAHLVDTSHTLGRAVRRNLQEAEDIDAMAAVWAEYDQQLAMSALVNARLAPVSEAVVEILVLCEELAAGWDRIQRVATNATETSDGAVAAHSRGEANGRTVAQMAEEFEASLSFITAGLRAVSRAGGHVALEALAERLEWRPSPAR